MTKHDDSKLTLKTETLMPLTTEEVDAVHGGITVTIAVTSSNPCLAATIAAGASSGRCAQVSAQTVARGNDFVKKKLGRSFRF